MGDNTLEGFEQVSERLVQIDSGTALAVRVLHWTSVFMWIPIVLSLLWLAIDIKRGKAPRFVMIGLLLAIPINIVTYKLLVAHTEQVLELIG